MTPTLTQEAPAPYTVAPHPERRGWVLLSVTLACKCGCQHQEPLPASANIAREAEFWRKHSRLACRTDAEMSEFRRSWNRMHAHLGGALCEMPRCSFFANINAADAALSQATHGGVFCAGCREEASRG